MQLERIQRSSNTIRTEPTMDAEVLEGDTMASISLRFNCTVADLKRLNKIDKDFEIFARKTIKIPLNPHNLLLDTLPTVHKSGNSSPKTTNQPAETVKPSSSSHELDEKLIVASVANSEYVTTRDVKPQNSRVKTTTQLLDHTVYEDFPRGEGDPSITDPLLDANAPIPTVVLAKPARMDFSFNGADFDMNWICLFICILALCFAIPLVYVFYIAEEKIHHDAVLYEASHHHDITHDGSM